MSLLWLCFLLLVFDYGQSFKTYLPKTALLIIDVQNDFCAGGSLAVPHGDDVIPVINSLRSKYDFNLVVFTMDWHPPGHISFFERFNDPIRYPGAQLYKEYYFDIRDGRGRRSQILWPTHAVQNTTGASLRIGLKQMSIDVIVHKGINKDVDSYSAFWDNDGVSETPLDSILRNNGIQDLIITGLALEYCVGNTAKHGKMKGYNVTIVKDGVGSMETDDILKEGHYERLKANGIKVVDSPFIFTDIHSSASKIISLISFYMLFMIPLNFLLF